MRGDSGHDLLQEAEGIVMQFMWEVEENAMFEGGGVTISLMLGEYPIYAATRPKSCDLEIEKDEITRKVAQVLRNKIGEYFWN